MRYPREIIDEVRMQNDRDRRAGAINSDMLATGSERARGPKGEG